MSNIQTDHSHAAPPPPNITGTAKDSERAKHSGEVRCGIATDLWLSLEPYPEDKEKCLSLRVDEEWCHLYNYDPFVWLSVQSAFCNCSDTLEVAVWYHCISYTIVGLVVRSKYSLTAECDKEHERSGKHAGSMLSRCHKGGEARVE